MAKAIIPSQEALAANNTPSPRRGNGNYTHTSRPRKSARSASRARSGTPQTATTSNATSASGAAKTNRYHAVREALRPPDEFLERAVAPSSTGTRHDEKEAAAATGRASRA